MRKSMYTLQNEKLKILLKQARVAAGLTQRQLADRLKTDHSRVSDYEHGQRRMDVVELEAYCEALGLTLEEFIKRYRESLEPPGESA